MEFFDTIVGVSGLDVHVFKMMKVKTSIGKYYYSQSCSRQTLFPAKIYNERDKLVWGVEGYENLIIPHRNFTTLGFSRSRLISDDEEKEEDRKADET